MEMEMEIRKKGNQANEYNNRDRSITTTTNERA